MLNLKPLLKIENRMLKTNFECWKLNAKKRMFHFENQYWKWCRMLKKDVKNVCWKVKIKCSKLICIFFFLTATKAICTYFFVLTAIMNHSNSQIGLAAKESFQWGLPPLNPFIWAMSGGELSWSYRNNVGCIRLFI